MNFLELIKALLTKPRLPTPPADFAGQRTNPARNRQRKLKRELGNRQYRRQTRAAYECCAMGLSSHQVLA